MIPTPETPRPHSTSEIVDVVERTSLAWIDQYNQHLNLTVQAVMALHKAFDAKFTR